MKPLANPLSEGMVLRTHPGRGFWGCAVVLTVRDGTADRYPMCHIAITTLIRRRKYSWRTVVPAELEIVKHKPSFRVGPNEYREAPQERTCIGIHAVKSADSLDIVGRVSPGDLYPYPLTFEVGDGSAGTYPLCGLIKERLGWEAVVAWRERHDHDALERDRQAGQELFERIERDRIAQARNKRSRGGA